MYNRISDPGLINCRFIDNVATKGGGIYNDFSDPILTDCEFVNNATSEGPESESTLAMTFEEGGGMFNRSSRPVLIRCSFVGNSSGTVSGFGFGSGMYNIQSIVSLFDCIFTGNVSSGSGGAIYNEQPSNALLSGTILCDNAPDQIAGFWTDNGGNTLSTSCDCPADIDGDGIVDAGDLNELLGLWGTTNLIADLNNDGIINGEDLTVLLVAWGACP